MPSRLPLSAALSVSLFFSLPASAKSVKDFEAMPAADQANYVANFVDETITTMSHQRPEQAQQIHAFYSQEPGKPMSEGLKDVSVELISLDGLANRGIIDLSKIEIEQIIANVTKQKFPPPHRRCF